MTWQEGCFKLLDASIFNCRCSYMRQGMQLAYQGLNLVVRAQLSISKGCDNIVLWAGSRHGRSHYSAVWLYDKYVWLCPFLPARFYVLLRPGLFVLTRARCVLWTTPPVCIRPYSVYSKAFSQSVQMWESVKSMTKTCIMHGSPMISS